jgi:hypothetical protein
VARYAGPRAPFTAGEFTRRALEMLEAPVKSR